MILRTLLPLTIVAACLSSSLPAATRPNVIAIVTDDQARWAMGAYGNDEVHTPNMDRIAREGALFTRAFANTPVCSPSRATYLTGLYSTEVGVTDHISPPDSEKGIGLGPRMTWPAVLQQNGYRTALIGKWHLGERPDSHPSQLGFDHFVGFLTGGRPMNPTLEVDGKVLTIEGPLPDILTDHAIDFIKSNRKGPFALSLHFRAPHKPYSPVPAEDTAHYTDLDPTVPDLPGLDIPAIKKSTKAYYGAVSAADRNIGRLLQALDELGLAENTLVVFTSDHGYNEGRHSISTKGNGHWIVGGIPGPRRPNMWDTSILIPMAVRWPAVIRPGIEIDELFSTIDVFRTILGAVGVPVPASAPARGLDCSPLLRGETIESRPVVFGQYDMHNAALAYLRMVRTHRYKLVRHFHTNQMDEFYDLERDPDEQINIIHFNQKSPPEYAHVEQRLQRELDQWMASIDDPLLHDNY